MTRRLNKSISYLENRYKKNIANKLVIAAGQVELKAKQLVAIDTGNLQDNIQTFPVTSPTTDVYSVAVGTRNVPYARYIEYGRNKAVNYYRGPRRKGRGNLGRTLIYSDSGDGLKYLRTALGDTITAGLIKSILFK